MTVRLNKTEEKLVTHMNKAGFPLAKHEALQRSSLGRVLLPPDELIFNRGLDGKSSNFVVFATREKDNYVTIDYYNPDPQGLTLKQDEFLVKLRLPKDASDDQVADAVQQIKKHSDTKPLNEFHFLSHSHFGRLSPAYHDNQGKIITPQMVDYDDGVSNLTDNVRKALLYHIDYHALTCHNSFSRKAYSFLSWAGQMLGFNPVPSIELTAVLKEPNGPHIVVWMRNMQVAQQVRRAILDRGQRLKMPSYFTGMSMFEMLDILSAFRDANKLALGIAHPVNFNSPSLPIRIVGLYTAVESGLITLDEAHGYAQKFDSIAMWNASLCSKAHEVPVNDKELKAFLRYVNRKHIGNKRLWVNQTNYALAEELKSRFGLYTHFETDEHATLPFTRDFKRGGYLLGGDSLCSGATVITVPEEIVNKLGQRPSAPQLIHLIRSKMVDMAGRVFAVKREEAMTVYSERSAIPKELRGIARQYKNGVLFRYMGMITRDFMDFLGEGSTYRIRNMPGN